MRDIAEFRYAARLSWRPILRLGIYIAYCLSVATALQAMIIGRRRLLGNLYSVQHSKRDDKCECSEQKQYRTEKQDKPKRSGTQFSNGFQRKF